jgi:hypothetical protein
MLINNQDINKPLIDDEDNYNILLKLMEKSEKIIIKKRKLEKSTINEINSYLVEMTDRLNGFINYDILNRKEVSDEHDGVRSNSKLSQNQYSSQYLTIKLDSFILVVKEKINLQLNKLNDFEAVNNKLLDDEDEEIAETIRIHNDSIGKGKRELKNIISSLEVLENLKNTLSKKGPKITKRKFSNDEEITGITLSKPKFNSNDKDLRYMNQLIGFLSLICIFGSILILIIFLWGYA